MKNIIFQILAVSFSMLVIPLFSLSGYDGNATETAAVNNDIIFEEKPNITLKGQNYESFKVLKDEKIYEISAKDYVFGVVAAEMPALYHEEALKAQAVAAYTFACYRKSANADADYDIAADPETAQCYITREEAVAKWGEKADEYTKKIEDCISQTEGQILTYDGLPIFAAYHAISPGITNACADVWGKELPYLTSQDSSFDCLADKYLSEVVLTKEELSEKLKNIATASGEAQNYFTDIKTADSGYVKQATYCQKTISGSDLSKLLGLRSGNFEITYSDGNFKFTVKGYGHGVGMSQNGADYMAKQGSNYKEILSHYYAGAKLEKI